MLGKTISFTSLNPGRGDLGFVRNIAGYLNLASQRVSGLGLAVRSCGDQVAESWTGAAHEYWDGRLHEQADVVEALGPQWVALDAALITYAKTVEDISTTGEECRAIIEEHLKTAASVDICARFMTVGLGEQYHVTLTVPLMFGATDEEVRAKQTQASDLQVLINAEVDKFWALANDRDAANLALVTAINDNLPAGWAEVKGSFPSGTNPATMLPAVPAEFYGFDGIDAAKRVTEMVDPETGEVDPRAWVIIEDHMDDSIFREQLMSILGPERAIALGSQAWIENLTGDSSKLDDLKVLMITGAPPARYDGDWVKAAQEAFEGLTYLPPGSSATTIIAGLVGDGTPVSVGGVEVSWNQDSLAVLANTILMGWQGYKPPTSWDTATAIYGALGNNAGAAALVFGAHPEECLADGKGPASFGPVEGFEDAYASFLRAATVTAAADPKWRGFADRNVSYIIDYFGYVTDQDGNLVHGARPDNQHFTDQTRLVFGDIAEAYWGSFEKSAIARWTMGDDPGVPGVERPYASWESFLVEGMRNPDAAIKIVSGFEDYMNGEASPGEFPDTFGGTLIVDRNGNAILDENGMEQFDFVRHGDSLGMYLERKIDVDMITARDVLINRIVDELKLERKDDAEGVAKLVSRIFGYAADPKGQLIVDVKGGLEMAVVNAIEVSSTELEKIKEMRVDNGLGELTSWESQARQDYASRQGKLGPVRVGLDGPIFSGDVSVYERQVQAQVLSEYGTSVEVRITDGNGSIRPLDELLADPWAYRAYVAWLQDPAVQESVYLHDSFIQTSK